VNCPHCGCQFEVKSEVPKGAISLSEFQERKTEKNEEKEPPKSPKRVRGPAREYSPFFERCWKVYGRKEEKWEAFAAWVQVAPSVGGEAELMDLVLRALKWQTPIYQTDGWKYARYFERYLKRRKWEDEPPPAPIAAVDTAEQRKAIEAKERTRRELERETAMTDKVLNDKYGGWR